MNKKLIVKQDGYKDCGVACLSSIIKYYGGSIPLSKLLDLTCTNKNGTNFYNLKKAAFEVGLDAQGFKVNDLDYELLNDIKLPSICQVIINNYSHFVVIYKIKKNEVLVMDPACGFKSIKKDVFFNSWSGYVLSFSKRKELPFFEGEKYLNKVIIDIILRNKCIVLNIILLSILFTLFSCFYSYYFQIIIDNAFSFNVTYLTIVTFIFLIILLLKLITSLVRNFLLIIINQKLDCQIFIKSFKKILLLPYSYYKNKTTGEIISRINDLVYVKNMLSKIILTVFLDCFIVFSCSLILFFINRVMFLVLLITILVYILIFCLFRPFFKKYTNIIQEDNSIINSKLIESINGFETIKNLNVEESINNSVVSLYVKFLNDIYNYDKINNIDLFIKDLLIYISILFIEFIGFSYVLNDFLSLGEVITFNTLLMFFIESIRNIIDLSRDYYYAVNSLRRANNLFDIESVDLLSSTNYDILGNILINNLSYSYDNYNYILSNINLSVKRGEKVLFLGKSGSGKSTLIKLLSKYYVPSRNTILLDGIDINDISVSNLKKYIVTISRDEVIFNDTIKNNILLNRVIDDNRFMEMCKLTCVDDIVKDLFLGYDTRLEENGQNISGGQRQRIILARSLLKSANIILIDEAFSAVDVDLERKILNNLFDKYSESTFIIISHRMENLDLYDKVIKLSDGKCNDLIYVKGVI